MNFAKAFFRKIIIKYLTTNTIEKVMILILEEAVERSDSKINKKLYETVFKSIKKDEE
ncbi:MAG: hypothetical protein ACRC5T_09105 [Cetobacterium sp.]